MISKSVKVNGSGISIVEVLVALAVLAIIGAVAFPSPQKSAARADLQAAVENLEQSIYLARSTAINTNSAVIMHLVPGTKNEPGKIGFSFTQPVAGTDALDSEYPFPPDIRLESTAYEVHFNSLGIVESPTRVALISDLDSDLNQRLIIQ